MFDVLFLDPLRTLLAVAVLIVPAWCLMRTLPDDVLPPGTRAVSWTVLGFAFLIVAGVLLDAVATLSGRAWGLALGLVVAGAVAWWRWSAVRRAGGLPAAPALDGGATSAWPAVHRAQAGMMLAALGITLGAVALARAGAHEALEAPTTELWASRTEAGAVQVSLRNLEGQAMSYRVEVRAGSRVLDGWQVSSLDSGETAVRDLASLADKAPIQAVKVELFRGDDPLPYRHLVLAR